MRGIPTKVEVVAGGPLPIYRLEILKDLIRKVALRKLEEIRNSVRIAA
jgi:hypothetical protein